MRKMIRLENGECRPSTVDHIIDTVLKWILKVRLERTDHLVWAVLAANFKILIMIKRVYNMDIVVRENVFASVSNLALFLFYTRF